MNKNNILETGASNINPLVDITITVPIQMQVIKRMRLTLTPQQLNYYSDIMWVQSGRSLFMESSGRRKMHSCRGGGGGGGGGIYRKSDWLAITFLRFHKHPTQIHATRNGGVSI